MKRSIIHFVSLLCILLFPVVAIAESEDLVNKAEQGDADAQYELGRMYIVGDGVPQDYDEAFRWFWKSAEQGDAKAQK